MMQSGHNIMARVFYRLERGQRSYGKTLNYLYSIDRDVTGTALVAKSKSW